jgi:hypothetical protein
MLLPLVGDNDIIFSSKTHEKMVGVAQLVRAPVCGTGGRGFNPLRPPQFTSCFNKRNPSFYKSSRSFAILADILIYI